VGYGAFFSIVIACDCDVTNTVMLINSHLKSFFFWLLYGFPWYILVVVPKYHKYVDIYYFELVLYKTFHDSHMDTGQKFNDRNHNSIPWKKQVDFKDEEKTIV